MFHLLSFVFFIIFVVIVLAFLVFMRILRFLGLGKKDSERFYRNENSSSANAEKPSDTITGKSNKKKVFDKSEGEYIDFEDV